MWAESHHLPFLSSLNLVKFRDFEIVLETGSFCLFYTLLFTLLMEINLIFKITQSK